MSVAQRAVDAVSRDRVPDGGTFGAQVVDTAIWLFALATVALFRVVDSTLDLRIFGHEHVAAVVHQSRPFLVVVWHGRGLLPIFFFQGYPLVIYSSGPRDRPQPFVARYARKITLGALQHLGYRVLDAAQYASESRGVIRFLQYLEQGRGGLIAADGPGGPMFHAKPGATYIAKKTGVALLPVAAAFRASIALDSWDHFEVPHPFTKAALVIGETMEVPDDLTDEQLEGLSQSLETTLNDLTSAAEVEVFAIATR